MPDTTRAVAVLDRVMEDHYVQEQLSAGAAHVRGAVEALTEAARRAAGKPPPEPKPRWRRLPVLLIMLAVAALVREMHRVQQSRPV
jgi:hypothetical protein